MSSESNAAHEPHPWVELTPNQVLDKLVHEIYTPVSALGSEVDRLASGSFEDDDLLELIGHLRENVNALGRAGGDAQALHQRARARRGRDSGCVLGSIPFK